MGADVQMAYYATDVQLWRAARQRPLRGRDAIQVDGWRVLLAGRHRRREIPNIRSWRELLQSKKMRFTRTHLHATRKLGMEFQSSMPGVAVDLRDSCDV